MIKKTFLLIVCVMLVIITANNVIEAAPTFKVKLVYTVEQGDILY